MLAKDIMTTNVIKITPGTTIAQAISILIDNKISGAPVVDEQDNVVGLVTEKDLLVAFDFVRDTSSKVESFMTKDVKGIGEDEPADQISRLLVSKNIKRVPVLKDKKILGIVSRRDVLKYILTASQEQ